MRDLAKRLKGFLRFLQFFCVGLRLRANRAMRDFGADPGQSNNVTGVDKKEKEAKRKKMLLLQNTTLKN